MIIGSVGSGKSSLLKAILGELSCDGGVIRVCSKSMAYCSQTPWLPNTGIREIVTGFPEEMDIDREWYDSVMHACAFDEDVSQMPNRDDTLVGSRGLTLSGGQKQRLVSVSFPLPWAVRNSLIPYSLGNKLWSSSSGSLTEMSHWAYAS
jgi:ABC-type bacteriocin/lantibiotic exporter with double-glycine peptidase domain